MKKIFSILSSVFVIGFTTVHSTIADETATLAESTTATQPTFISALGNIFPLLIVVMIFYFLIIRPQQKKLKEHRDLLSNVKKGDRIVSTSGIHGIITKVDETTVNVEVAPTIQIKMQKDSISIINTGGHVEQGAKTKTKSHKKSSG